MHVTWELVALSPCKFWGGLRSPLKVPFCLLTVEGARTIKVLTVFLKIRRGLMCHVWSENASKFAIILFRACGDCYLQAVLMGQVGRASP